MLGDLRHTRLARRADLDDVSGVGSDLGRPGDPLLVVVRLDDAGNVAPHADSVRAHDDRVFRAVLAEIRRPIRVGVLGAELEDVPHLDPVAQDQLPVAIRAGIALAGIRDVGGDFRLEVPAHVHVPVVEALAVGAGDQVRRARHEVVDHDDGPLRTDR